MGASVQTRRRESGHVDGFCNAPLQSCSPTVAPLCGLTCNSAAFFNEGLKIYLFFFLFPKTKKTSGNLRIGLCERETETAPLLTMVSLLSV